MIEFQEFAVLIINAAITAAIPVVASLIVLGLNNLNRWLRSLVNDQWEAAFDNVITLVVQAAEQSKVAGLIGKTGAEAKAYAIRQAQNILRARGLGHLADNVDEIEARIEAAILQGIQKPVVVTTTTTTTDPIGNSETTTVQPAVTVTR